jgi:hypothetical protein
MGTVTSVKVHAVLTATGKETIELFSTREEAEGFLAEVRGDEPDLADSLGIEAIEIGEENPN